VDANHKNLGDTVKAKLWSHWQWFWFKALLFTFRRLQKCVGAATWHTCANRCTVTCNVRGLVLALQVKNTRGRDGYSREELIEMLQLIRKHERQLGWKVPEPEVLP
jgi:hypothetical protein